LSIKGARSCRSGFGNLNVVPSSFGAGFFPALFFLSKILYNRTVYMFPKVKAPKKIIYLDSAAANPLHPKVLKAMRPFFCATYGNPSSLHKQGIEAKKAVEESRGTIARLINAKPEEIVFTAGGTESVNLAIFGVAREQKRKLKVVPHIITTAIEHHSVLNSFQALREEGFKTSVVTVDKEGFIDLKKLKQAVRPETVLISVMYANNEIGTVQPIAEIGKWLKAENEKRKAKNYSEIIFHTDACQAAGSLDINVQKLGVDLMSLNAGKIYGPKQVGFLYVKKGIVLKPILYGGGQERGLRSGTENVASIVGFAEALKNSREILLKENERLKKLSLYLFLSINKNLPNIELNGPALDGRHIKRLPNNINFFVKGVQGEDLMLYLDSYNIAVSTGSACSTGTAEEASHVLRAIGRSHKEAKSGIRITLTNYTNKKEIDYLLKVFPEIVKQLRK